MINKALSIAFAFVFSTSAHASITLLRNGVGTDYETIQSALNDARPGDTIQIGGGHYHESLTFVSSGQPDLPITLEGKMGEKVILDGADPALQKAPNNAWSPITYKDKVFYVTEVPFRGDNPGLAISTWISYSDIPGPNHCDRLIAAYASLDGLYAAPRGEGSFRKGSTVTIHLNDDLDPNTVALNISQSQSIINTGNHSHIRIRNLELRNAGWSAIIVGDTASSSEMAGTAELDNEPTSDRITVVDIEISDCIIKNSFRAISTGSLGIRDLRILRNVVANGLSPDWPWGGAYASGIGQAVGNNSDGLAPYRGFGFRLVRVYDSVIADCLISGQWDGMGLKKCHNVAIHNNTIRNIQDDGIELESPDQSNIKFYNNHLYHVFAGVSVTSNYPGPIYVYRNVVEVTHRGGRGFANASYGVKSGMDSLGRAENIKFYHNTFFGTSFNVWEKLGDPAPNRWQGYDFVNNIFISSRDNYNFRGMSGEESGDDNHWESNAYNQSQPDERGAVFIPEPELHFVDSLKSSTPLIPRNFHLKDDSPLRNSGSNYPTENEWPDSVTSYPQGRNLGAWEDGMQPDDIGAPPQILALLPPTSGIQAQ